MTTALAQFVTAWETSKAQFEPAWQDSSVSSLTVVSSIDAGNVNQALVTVSLANTLEPVVYLDVRSAVGPWWNMVFTIANCVGKRPIFQVNRNTHITSNNPPSSWRPAYSYDTRSFTNWTRASSRSNIGGTTGYFQWQFDEAFTSDGPIIATSPLGRTQDVDHFVQQQLSTNSACAPAPCASTNGVFNVTPSENDELGGPIGGKPMHALLYDWGGTSNDGYPKRVATVITHIHAQGEATNWQSFRYWLDWLHGNDPKAVALRANWKFLLYTPAMPNGLFGGDRRGVVTRNTYDPNRVWDVSSFQEIDAIKAAIVNDVGSLGLSYHAMMSWHGGFSVTNPARAYVVPADTSAGTRSRFTSAMGTAVGSYLAQSFEYDSSGTFNTAVWWAQTQGVHFRWDIETPVTGDTSLSAYQAIGEAWGKAMADMDAQGRFIPGVPDFTITAADGVQFLDPSGDGGSPTKDLSKQIESTLMLSDERQFDRFLHWVSILAFGESATGDLLPGDGGGPQEYTRAPAADGLLLGESVAFEYLLRRLSSLVLQEITVLADRILPGSQEILRQDGILLDDGMISDRGLRILISMLLDDSSMKERALDAVDRFMLADTLCREIELSRQSQLFMDETIMNLRELLWGEGLLLKSSAERAVLGVIIAFLARARLTVRDPLGVRLGVRDPLGVQVGVTDWRQD